MCDAAPVCSTISGSLDATVSIAKAFAGAIRPGDVVALNGELGAGKTAFVRALAAALDCDPDDVNSPTFGLVQNYAGRLPIVHIDAYRLRDADEFEELGGRELFIDDGLTLIEWAGRIEECLPRELWKITAEHASESSRRYNFRSTHLDAVERMNQLSAAIGSRQSGVGTRMPPG